MGGRPGPPPSLILQKCVICTEARAVASGTIKILQKSASEFTQLLQLTERPNVLGPACSYQSHMVAHGNYEKKPPQKASSFGALSVGPSQDF